VEHEDLAQLSVEEKRRLARELLRRKKAAEHAGAMMIPSDDGLPAYTSQTYDMFLHSASKEHAESKRFLEWIREVEADGAYAFEAARLTPQKTDIEVQRSSGDVVHCINMSSYNYLGYGVHPQVIEAAKAALDQYGLGCASSPVISGTFAIHKKLEQDLLDFYGLPGRAVSLFSSGYGVNTGVISSYVKQGHHVVLDRSAHMSILEGAQLSKAQISYFRHNDAANLEQILRRLSQDQTRMLVCVEGVYSADGDFGRLQAIVEVAKRYGAAVLVDEAHSILLAGPTGRGVSEAEGVLEDVDLIVITFSKAFGAVGGALIAREAIVRYVNWYAKCRMFSCGLDPAVTGGIAKSLELGRSPDGDARRKRLVENARLLRDLLKDHVDIGTSESWIIPVIYGPERLTIPLNNWLQQRGLDSSVMQFPAVPKNESRIRLFVTSEHEPHQIQTVARVIREAAHHFQFGKSPTLGG